MAKEYTVPLREAAQLLDKKPATIRAYVRSGKLSKQYVDGFNGQEMRLNKEELEEIREALQNTVIQPSYNTAKEQSHDTAKDTVRDTVTIHGPADPNLARAIELLEKEISELRKEKESLRTEEKELSEKNFQMAGQLGYFQNQVETLKEQVKQLSAPVEQKQTTSNKFTKRSSGLLGMFGLGRK